MRRFRDDLQFQIVLVLSARRGSDGATWYRLSLPGRPNGQRGWVPSDAVDVQPVRNRITVRLGERRIEIRRVGDGKLLLQGIVAIGRAGAETPLGRNFYVRSGFVPTDPFFGTYALETSAGSQPDRLAGSRHRRHPRHQSARAPRSGGLARMHSRRQRSRDAAPDARPPRDADRHRALNRVN